MVPAMSEEQLKGVVDLAAVVAIAKSAGFLISAEELQRAQAEISEEELEGVSGGKLSFMHNRAHNSQCAHCWGGTGFKDLCSV